MTRKTVKFFKRYVRRGEGAYGAYFGRDVVVFICAHLHQAYACV